MRDHKQTVGSALRAATALLAPVSGTPRLDAEVLLSHVLQWRREQLLAELQQTLADEHQARYRALLQRRSTGEPVAYLVGHKEFYALDFYVDRRVLIPRPETEMLVDLAREWLGEAELRQPIIADLGTGSGCIAIALALALPKATIYAIDNSREALEVARLNIERHEAQGLVQIIEGDGLVHLPEPVDLLVSNPPYTVLAEIEPGVRQYEPHNALDGGPDGLAPYRWLLPAAAAAVKQTGAVLLEIGATQGQAVVDLAGRAFPGARIKLYQDLAGFDRVVGVYR